MSYPPLPSNGETQWGDKFRTWADALESGKVEGTGITLRQDASVGHRVFLDHSWGSTMIHGDTGWRDVTPPLPDRKMLEGSIRIRRVNSILTIWLKDVMFDEMTEPTLITAVPAPIGMLPPTGIRATFDIGDTHIGTLDEIVIYAWEEIFIRWQSRKTPSSRSSTTPATLIPRSGLVNLTLLNNTWPASLPGTPV